ncbi:hypothetical protein P280DRAFT_464894 [Massarina eburnea CBS 473.64]|uniref:Uncharacterized protein n=1 Tax=Massarina eburnea CBS 473.64 TaxID=1395130 RepID=A0A6A6SFY4_9PLEO|nr:hypothetical protein P280DRAFT_464894 [Massarina eburnea CBS 473.64]
MLTRDLSDHRMSTGSVFCIPTFPSPCHNLSSAHDFASSPPTFALSRPFKENDDYTCVGPSSPFEMLLDITSSPSRPLLDEYDPEHPHLVFHTPPPNTKTGPRNFSAPFSTIPEESSAQSNRTAGYSYLPSVAEDSSPCSPKTVPAIIFGNEQEREAYNLPISATTIPEEPCDTIDPAVLSKEAFHSLNIPFDPKSANMSTTRGSMNIPNSPGCAKSIFDPLIEAAFPSSPPILTHSYPGLHLAEQGGSPSSMYSLPSSPISMAPSSPRPRHAELPYNTNATADLTPSLNFTTMPTLSPLPAGPRVSPPRPLRSSIQKLRRMNSDAEKGEGRGERRYLRLGREDSIPLPGEESWLDGLDEPCSDANTEDETQVEGEGGEEAEGEDMDETWDEEKGRRLVGDLLNGWEEEATVLDLEDTEKEKGSKDNSNLATVGEMTEPPSTPPMRMEEPKGLLVTSSPENGDAEERARRTDRSSSIWEDGEKFWQSTPPFPPNSPNKPKQRFLPLSSSPLLSATASPGKNGKKRSFEVAKDEPESLQEDSSMNGKGKRMSTEEEKREKRLSAVGNNRYRKRSALGPSTPNVRFQMQVQPPSSTAGTPGSLYDADGFYRET